MPPDRPAPKEIVLHYYQFHIGDYRKDTSHLTPIEHYIYRTLIDWHYLDELPIPKETQSVLRRLGLGSENECNLQNVLNDFFVITANGWEHGRIKRDIEDYADKCAKNKNNGIKGGRPRKTQSLISGNPKKPNHNPNQEPLTTNHNPDNKKPSAAFALPDWIDADDWNLWIKTRKGKKMLPEQMQAQVEKLRKWKDEGLPYWEALRDSASNGWQGLFEPKVKLKNSQDSKLDVVNQIMGGRNGANRQTRDITPQCADQGNRASIPETIDGIWESDCG